MANRDQILRSIWKKIISTFKSSLSASSKTIPTEQAGDRTLDDVPQLAYRQSHKSESVKAITTEQSGNLSLDDHQQLTYFQSHPPRCLEAFKVSLFESDDTSTGGHGEELSTIFRVFTQSDTDTFQIHGNLWNNPPYGNVFMWPIKLQCEDCDKPELLFDIRQHGYNAESGWSPDEEYGKPTQYVCPECQGELFRVEVTFSYPDDLFDEDDFAGNQHNLFTWIALTCTCTQCSTRHQIADYECS